MSAAVDHALVAVARLGAARLDRLTVEARQCLLMATRWALRALPTAIRETEAIGLLELHIELDDPDPLIVSNAIQCISAHSVEEFIDSLQCDRLPTSGEMACYVDIDPSVDEVASWS